MRWWCSNTRTHEHTHTNAFVSNWSKAMLTAYCSLPWNCRYSNRRSHALSKLSDQSKWCPSKKIYLFCLGVAYSTNSYRFTLHRSSSKFRSSCEYQYKNIILCLAIIIISHRFLNVFYLAANLLNLNRSI